MQLCQVCLLLCPHPGRDDYLRQPWQGGFRCTRPYCQLVFHNETLKYPKYTLQIMELKAAADIIRTREI